MSEKPKGKGKFRSLTFTIAIAFLALSMSLLVIASGLDIYFSFQAQQEVVSEQQQLIAREAASTVSDFVSEKFSVMEASVRVGELIHTNQESRVLVMEKLLGIEDSFRQLALLDVRGQELAIASRLSKAESGKLVEQAGAEMSSHLSEGENHISSIYIDEITSEPMVIMAVPIRDILGKSEGALLAEVNLKFMWDLVGRMQIGDTGLAYVVDGEGNLIAFGDISRVLRGENMIYLEEVAGFVNDEDYDKGEVHVSDGIGGTPVVATHVPLGTPDWAVVVELPAEEAYENVSVELSLLGMVLVLSFVLAIVSGFYLSRRITKPIINLRDAAIRIGKGSLDTKIRIKAGNEVGELANAFNQMTIDLKKSRKKLEEYSRTLEEKVKERTKELEKSKKELEETNYDLERFNKLAVGRELRMIELKKRIKELEGKLEVSKAL
jgi:methyl-accepting chemotaxis protein